MPARPTFDDPMQTMAQPPHPTGAGEQEFAPSGGIRNGVPLLPVQEGVPPITPAIVKQLCADWAA